MFGIYDGYPDERLFTVMRMAEEKIEHYTMLGERMSTPLFSSGYPVVDGHLVGYQRLREKAHRELMRRGAAA